MRLSLFIILLISLPQAFALMNCQIQNLETNPCTTGTVVLWLTDSIDSHVHIAEPSPAEINYGVCCSGVADLVVGGSGTFFVGASSTTDGHVATNPSIYANNRYLSSATNDITCAIAADCAAGGYDTCLYAVPNGADQDTHVMDCASTTNRMCCRATVIAGPSCSDTDNGNNYYVQGTTVDSDDPPRTDTCVAGALTEYFCENNQTQFETFSCPNGCDAGGSGACQAEEAGEFPCTITDIFWTDGYEHNLQEAVLSLPVYAIITGTNCTETTADFEIYDRAGNLAESNPEGDNALYLEEDGSWSAQVTWIPNAGGEYYFTVNSANGENTLLSSNEPNYLTVTGACLVEEDDPPCPQEWLEIPENPYLDADCDGVRDCFDGWVGNYGGEIDPVTGIPIGLVGCEADAWDCSGTSFGGCEPDSDNPSNAIQRRQGSCVKKPEYTEYCPPPSDERGCVIEEDFPLFGWFNFLIVSLLLIGFYSFKRNVY